MKNLLLLIALCFSTIIFAQGQTKYKYELNKEYVFTSGDIEMKVFLDAKGNATVSRNKTKAPSEKASFVFFQTGDEVVFGYNSFNLKDNKLSEKYWLIPFDASQTVIHMREVSDVKVECICAVGSGSCSAKQVSGGNTVSLACVSDNCPVCEMKNTPIGHSSGRYLMIKAESVQIAEK